MVVWVRIVVLKSTITLAECQGKPRKWEDTAIPPQDAKQGVPFYKELGGAVYPEHNLLNPWISGNRSLKRGQVLEGAVVAQSFGLLPAWV
jgi:hypothetical protein